MQPHENSFLSGPNASFIEELYARYIENPDSVDPSWRRFFAELQDDSRAVLDEVRGASWAPRPRGFAGNGLNGAAAAETVAPEQVHAAARDSIRALMLIRSYRVRGHLEANLDPLNLRPHEPHPELDPRTYGFTEADMDRPVYIGNILGLG